MSITVHVGKGNIEKAIKKLGKIMIKEGILSECKQRLFYEKPSSIKRREMKRNISKIKKENGNF